MRHSSPYPRWLTDAAGYVRSATGGADTVAESGLHGIPTTDSGAHGDAWNAPAVAERIAGGSVEHGGRSVRDAAGVAGHESGTGRAPGRAVGDSRYRSCRAVPALESNGKARFPYYFSYNT